MFAIIQTSGRQFRVEPGAVIEISGHGSDAGAELTFDQVCSSAKMPAKLIAGAPFVSGAKVLGVVDAPKAAKVRIFKKKRRKQYRRTKGHRSLITRVRITDIQV